MNNLFEKLPAEEKEKVTAAIEDLLENNPKLPEQLQKLAAIKKNKPLTWNMALGILNKN